MAEIKVSSAGMREKAATFRSIAESIKTYTEDMTTKINNLRPYWEGDASEKTVNDFNKFQATFEEKYNTIIGYAAFLEQAADSYDKTENLNAQ